MEDCSCGCLVKMVHIADGCVYESGLELTQTQRRGQLSYLLYDNHGFCTPYVCLLTDGDLKESSKMSPRIRIVAPSSGVLKMETSGKNGYQLMDVAYLIDFDGCINLTTGWKEFATESGFEDGDVVMVMFLREDDSLTFRIYVL
ncbi:hypothetical protein VPH35_109251 [Triticum aestivum]